MHQKVNSKYLIVCFLCLLSFCAIKVLYETEYIFIDVFYSMPSFIGSLCLSIVPIPLIVLLKKNNLNIFIYYVFFTVLVLIFDEYNTFISENKIFDFLDILGIILGGITAIMTFRQHLNNNI